MTSSIKRLRNRSPQRARSTRQGGQWNPQYLGLYSAYDGHLTGTASLITDTSPNARANMTLGAAAAAPYWLPYTGTSYWWGSGVVGQYAVASDAAALDITGDLELVVRCALDSWATADVIVIGKMQAAGNYSYCLISTAAGRLQFKSSADGTAITTTTASTGHGFSAATPYWMKVTRRSSDGRLQFFTAADQATEPTAGQWTQLGTDQTGATGAMFSGTNQASVGTSSGSITAHPLGKFYNGIIRNGIDGTIALNFVPDVLGVSGGTDSAGRTWTLFHSGSGRKSSLRSVSGVTATSCYVTATDDYFAGPAAAVPPATAGASCSMWAVVRPWATQVANTVIFTTRSGTGAGVTLRLASATTLVADVSDGSTTVTTPAVSFTAGQRLVAGVILTGGAPGTATVFVNSTIGSTVARNGTTETGGALYACSDSTPANYAALEVRVPFMASATALTATDTANLAAYYGGGL